MTPFYLLIMAIVLPTGQVEVSHTFVPKCPTQEEVVAVMKPMKDSGKILAWGGSCSAMTPKTDA